MKKENLINEIKRISTLMLISNKNNFIYESLNENKKSLLNEDRLPPIEPLIDKFVSSYEKLEKNYFKNELSTRINNQSAFQTSSTNLSGKLREILNQAKNMPNLPADVIDIILPLYKINSQKDKTFAKSVSDGLFDEFERGINSTTVNLEEVIKRYTELFGENVVKNLKAKNIEKTRGELFNYSKINTSISPLTTEQIKNIEKYTSSDFKNIFQNKTEKLITNVENIYKLVKNYENLVINGENALENKRVLNDKLEDFAKTYNEEFRSLITSFQNPNAPPYVKDAYQDIIKNSSVSRKMEIMSECSGNKTLWEKFKTLCNNIGIGLKNAFFTNADKGVKKKTIKREFDLPEVAFENLKENVGYLGTYLRILLLGVSKGLPGAKFKNPLWQKALMEYGKRGVKTQVISEMVGRMFKYQLFFTIINLFIGIVSNFKYDDKVLECEEGCDKKENQDNNGKIIKIPKECISSNSFTQFLFLRALKYHRFTDDNALKRSVINMGQDIMGSSSWGQATKFFPGLVDDIIVFLSETNVSDTSPTKEEKKGKHKEWAKRKESQLLEVLNNLNNEAKEIVDSSEEISNDSNNDSDSTIVPPPPVVYANNKPSFIKYLKTINKEYKEGSYSEDGEGGQDNNDKWYEFVVNDTPPGTDKGNFKPIK